MRKAVLFLMLVAPLAAQHSYPSHNFTFGAGGGLPGADLTGLFGNSPAISIGYGYRFHRNFQLDFGLDALFGAAGIRDYLETDFGSLRIKDYQFLVPFGGRVVLPLWRDKVRVSAGGGGAHLRYSELLRQPSDYYRFECPSCVSRSGWGYYALAGANVALDYDQHFRLGIMTKIYRGHTSGEALGSVPSLRTRDKWVNIFGEFGFSF